MDVQGKRQQQISQVAVPLLLGQISRHRVDSGVAVAERVGSRGTETHSQSLTPGLQGGQARGDIRLQLADILTRFRDDLHGGLVVF